MKIIMQAVVGIVCVLCCSTHASDSDQGHAALQALVTKLNDADKKKKEQKTLKLSQKDVKSVTDDEQTTFYNQTKKEKVQAKL